MFSLHSEHSQSLFQLITLGLGLGLALGWRILPDVRRVKLNTERNNCQLCTTLCVKSSEHVLQMCDAYLTLLFVVYFFNFFHGCTICIPKCQKLKTKLFDRLTACHECSYLVILFTVRQHNGEARQSDIGLQTIQP